MDELVFDGKTILVVGGSSGIGNGIAQAFLRKGGVVHVCGTRSMATDYSADEGSDLKGMHYLQLNVADSSAIEVHRPTFDNLDVLVPRARCSTSAPNLRCPASVR